MTVVNMPLDRSVNPGCVRQALVRYRRSDNSSLFLLLSPLLTAISKPGLAEKSKIEHKVFEQ